MSFNEPSEYKGEIKVLDHGYVKYIDHMGTDETVIEAARMSTGKGFEGWEKDLPLLDYLYRHKHMTPFEMPVLHIEVQAPLFVFREWHRHRSQSYNEFSARYSVMPNLHYEPSLDRVRQKQSALNKQGGSDKDLIEESIAKEYLDEIIIEQEHLYENYESMLERGMAKEVARINTPVSRYSKMRATCDLRNWLAFLKLRMAPDAQYEIREYANAVAEIIKQLWPRTYSLFEEYDLHGVSISRTELQVIRDVVAQLEADYHAGYTAGLAEESGLVKRKLTEFLTKVGLKD